MTNQQTLWKLLSVLLLVPLVGCATRGRITCVRFPDFYQPELRRVAVIPFSSKTGNPADGELFAGLLQSELVRNGTYDVFTREQVHLMDIDSEKVLSLIQSGKSDETKRIGRLATVQAVIVGTVAKCEFTERQERKQREVPIYRKDDKGKEKVAGYRTVEYVYTIINAIFQCLVHVVDTGSGRVVASVPVNLTSSNSFLPLMSARSGPAILGNLQAKAVKQVVREIAVTTTPVRLPRNPIKIATGRYDGKWEFEKNITLPHDNLTAVVRLPTDAARNQFRLVIVPRKERAVLSERRFVWPENAVEHAVRFDIAPILEKNGCGPLTAKLYSGEVPIATCNFALVEPQASR